MQREPFTGGLFKHCQTGRKLILSMEMDFTLRTGQSHGPVIFTKSTVNHDTRQIRKDFPIRQIALWFSQTPVVRIFRQSPVQVYDGFKNGRFGNDSHGLGNLGAGRHPSLRSAGTLRWNRPGGIIRLAEDSYRRRYHRKTTAPAHGCLPQIRHASSLVGHPDPHLGNMDLEATAGRAQR